MKFNDFLNEEIDRAREILISFMEEANLGNTSTRIRNKPGVEFSPLYNSKNWSGIYEGNKSKINPVIYTYNGKRYLITLFITHRVNYEIARIEDGEYDVVLAYSFSIKKWNSFATKGFRINMVNNKVFSTPAFVVKTLFENGKFAKIIFDNGTRIYIRTNSLTYNENEARTELFRLSNKYKSLGLTKLFKAAFPELYTDYDIRKEFSKIPNINGIYDVSKLVRKYGATTIEKIAYDELIINAKNQQINIINGILTITSLQIP